MSKAYQVITEQGLVIPPALCASAQLGGEVLLEIEPGRIAIRPVCLSEEDARRRALRYLLTTLGDALSISAPSLAWPKCGSGLVVYRQPKRDRRNSR